MNKGQISLIGALWFYLSLYYILELPKEMFHPNKQRELIASNTALGENNTESQKKSAGNSKLVFKILCEVLKSLG